MSTLSSCTGITASLIASGVNGEVSTKTKKELHECNIIHHMYFLTRWLGSRVVSVLDSGTERPGFKSQARH